MTQNLEKNVKNEDTQRLGELIERFEKAEFETNCCTESHEAGLNAELYRRQYKELTRKEYAKK